MLLKQEMIHHGDTEAWSIRLLDLFPLPTGVLRASRGAFARARDARNDWSEENT